MTKKTTSEPTSAEPRRDARFLPPRWAPAPPEPVAAAAEALRQAALTEEAAGAARDEARARKRAAPQADRAALQRAVETGKPTPSATEPAADAEADAAVRRLGAATDVKRQCHRRLERALRTHGTGWAEAVREQAERERADLDELLGVFGERLRSLERLGYLTGMLRRHNSGPVGDYSRQLRPPESRRRRDPLDELRGHIDAQVQRPQAEIDAEQREQEQRTKENAEMARMARGGRVRLIRGRVVSAPPLPFGRLLRQPHGCESLNFASVDAPAGALPVTKPTQVPGGGVDGRVALDPVTPQAQDREGQVAEVAHLDNLRTKVGEGAGQARPPTADPVVAAIAALHPGQNRESLHVFVQHGEQGVEVPVLERLKRAIGQFHVLLRHRLLPQPHGFEGVRSTLVHADFRDLAVANGPDVPVNAAFDRGAAAATTARHSHEGEDQVVANLFESLDLDLDLAPGLGEFARPLLNLTDPVPRP